MASRNIYISYLRVLATLSVVAIHASTGYLNKFHAQSFDWNYANWINAFSRCAVPVFVVVSGYLLLPKQENLEIFYKKRLSKIMWPFIFWTIIYVIYYFSRITNSNQLSTTRIMEIIYQKICNGANAHLWYLYMIVGLYLAIPFIQKMVLRAKIRDIEYFLAFWLAASFFKFQFIREHFPKIDLSFFTAYIGYLVLGYYIQVKSFRWSKYLYLVIYVLGGVFTAIMTFYLSKQHGKYDPTFYNYLTPNTILITVAICLFIKQYTVGINHLPAWIASLDKYSFGIYLVHIIPLNYLHPIVSKYLHTSLVVPIATAATVATSVGIIYLIRLIPGGSRISG